MWGFFLAVSAGEVLTPLSAYFSRQASIFERLGAVEGAVFV
jgi:hypothetical protein